MPSFLLESSAIIGVSEREIGFSICFCGAWPIYGNGLFNTVVSKESSTRKESDNGVRHCTGLHRYLYGSHTHSSDWKNSNSSVGARDVALRKGQGSKERFQM